MMIRMVIAITTRSPGERRSIGPAGGLTYEDRTTVTSLQRRRRPRGPSHPIRQSRPPASHVPMAVTSLGSHVLGQSRPYGSHILRQSQPAAVTSL